MSTWKEVKLKQLIKKLGDGGTPSTLDPNNFGGNIPWVVVEDIKSEIYSTKESLSEKGLKSCSAKMWPEGSVVLSTGATIGKVGIAKVTLCTKQGITGIVCNEYLHNYFLKNWFQLNENTLLRFSQGTTFKEIRPRPLGNLRIKIPSPFEEIGLFEQKVIVGTLSKVDEAIEAVENSIKASERLKKSLMQNLLTGKLKPDGTWRTKDDFYTDEKFGRVPKGWRAGNLGDIAEIIAGQSPTGDTYNEEGKGMPMLNGPTEFTDYYPIPVQYTTKPTKVCRAGDILFTVRGSSTGRMNFADQEYCIGRGIAAIKANEGSDNDFLYYTLIKIANMILAVAKGAGSTFPNVNRGELLKKKIICPSLKDVQAKIGKNIRVLDNFIQSQKIKTQALKTLKKSLMQNLLTGKVWVDVEKINKMLEEVN